MANKFLWKIGGEAGFGIMTTGLLFSKIAARHGYNIFDYFEYPSLIRGGHNTTETVISDVEVHTTKQEIDVLLCLNKETYDSHKHRLHKNSIIVFDKSQFTPEGAIGTMVDLPLKPILLKENGSIVMMNNIALGATLAIMNWDLSILNANIESAFAKKGTEIVEKNKRIAELGFNHITKNYPSVIQKLFAPTKHEDSLILTGNDAFALSAIAADCRLYAAYPMTPSSTVLSTLAQYAKQSSMVVRHAEDEISVINTALGASFAGVRSAVGTSGGGFALMVESISFAGVAEIPLVVFLSQRPGPATGLPTWTEQGDLLFAVNAGHGEFPKIVLAPGDIEEMIELTGEAFDLADIYQTPVIIMSDKLLSESHKSTSATKFKLWAKGYKPDRGKIIENVKSPYLRYELTDDGVSPMLIPGLPGHFYQANSYEHVEDGHTTEGASERVDQVKKRNRKEETYLQNHFKLPKVFGNTDGADIIFVSWGSNKGAILEAMKTLAEKGKESSYLHFTHVYPIDEEKVRSLFAPDKKYLLIENNSHGQFGRLLRQQTGVEIKDKLLKYDGRPIGPEEICDYVERIM